jgi:biotin synthase-like enzyme
MQAVPADTSELGLCVALSVGELDKDKYQSLYDAGARRYLLRIESSNPELYATIHPAAQRWERRVECIKALKEVGFQVRCGAGPHCRCPSCCCAAMMCCNHLPPTTC